MVHMDASAETILEGLDDAQRAAATTVNGPVRIIAGAGAGKTRTVTRRIAYALSLIQIRRFRRSYACRSRRSPYH